MTEKKIAHRLFVTWLRSDTVAHNINMFPFESDVLALKPSGNLIEYEIKISVSDFRADFKKRKKPRRYINEKGFTRHEFLQSGKGANKFYYVMPSEIYEKVSGEVPDWAGVITAGTGVDLHGEYLGLTIKRMPKNLHSRKFYSDTKEKIMKAMYWKAWNKLEANS